MSLISWYLKKRKEQQIVEALREGHVEPQNHSGPIIKAFERGNVVASICAELHDGETQMRVSFYRRCKKMNGKHVWLGSFEWEDLEDVRELILMSDVYLCSFPR